MEFDKVREDHRRWLAHHGLLDRPWFVLGSAPHPNIPHELLNDAALICINNSGITTSRLGMRPADLTFRNKSKEWKTIEGIKVPLLVWVCKPWQVWWKRFLISRKTELGEIRVMRRKERKHIGEAILREPNRVGEIGKPSTGIFAALYGLFVGIPEIVLGGFSMDKKGYAYQTERMRMLHRNDDQFALETIAKHYPNVSTTEHVVAEATGVPLYLEKPQTEQLGCLATILCGSVRADNS
jgi:hypothetical protein